MIRADSGGISNRVLTTFLQIGKRLGCADADGVFAAPTVDFYDVAFVIFDEFVPQLAVVKLFGALNVMLPLLLGSHCLTHRQKDRAPQP